jgi:endonuclease/exonuclease/phosphatase family metal-dependent hydrolase
VVTGLPAEAPALFSREAEEGPEAAPGRLRLVSWNIHRGYGEARLTRGLSAVLDACDPHVILLQEVPVSARSPFWELDGPGRLLRRFRVDYAPMHTVLRSSPHYPFEHTGVATLSRIGTVAAQAVSLPDVSRPKLGPHHRVHRVAVHTAHRWRSHRVEIINLHLENTTGPDGRRRQLGHLLDEVGAGVGPTIFGGDFNTLFGPLEKVRRDLELHGFSATDRGARLRPRLDHFFLRGCTAVSFERLRIGGSDHRPIALAVELSRGSPAP